MTNKKIFQEGNVINVCREKRCRILKGLAEGKKTTKLPALTKNQKKKHAILPKKYMETEYLIFSNKYRWTEFFV